MDKNMKTNLENLAKEIRELETFKAELESDIESKKDMMKEIMTSENVDDVKTDLFHIIWKKVISNRFDSTSFKKDNPGVYEKYTKQTESRPFKIV